jgi:hypothetical protein
MRRRAPFGFSRRKLLQALGLGTAVGPLIPILNASGQENLRPKRLVLIFEPDGAPALDWNNRIDWRPQGTETNFTLHPIHAPYEAVKSKIVVPWGLTLTAGGAGEQHAYGMAGLWTASTLSGPSPGADFDGGNGNRTGWGSGPSIDQVIAKAFGPDMPYQRAADDPMPETRFRTVELGVKCLDPTSLNRMIYAAANQPLHPEMNPRSAFNRLFAGVNPGDGPPAEDPSVAQNLAEQRAIVDLLKGDLTRLRGRIGKEDYAKLDAHLEGLLALERRLNTPPPEGGPALSCTVPGEPPNDTAFPTEIRQMMDIAAGALSCDVTRVLSLQLSYAFSHVRHSWLGHTSDHHTMSHDGTDRRAELSAIDQWYAEQITYFLQKLDSIDEGGSTLLDNTLVVIGRELGSTAHRMERWPVVLAGRARGALATGRYLNYDGQQHAKLLVSIGRMMGLDLNGFGNREPGSGPLSGLA